MQLFIVTSAFFILSIIAIPFVDYETDQSPSVIGSAGFDILENQLNSNIPDDTETETEIPESEIPGSAVTKIADNESSIGPQERQTYTAPVNFRCPDTGLDETKHWCGLNYKGWSFVCEANIEHLRDCFLATVMDKKKNQNRMCGRTDDKLICVPRPSSEASFDLTEYEDPIWRGPSREEVRQREESPGSDDGWKSFGCWFLHC